MGDDIAMKYLDNIGTQEVVEQISTNINNSSWVTDYQEYNEALSGYSTYVWKYANNTFRSLMVMKSNSAIDYNFVRLSSVATSGLSALTYALVTPSQSWYEHVESGWIPIKTNLLILQTSNWCRVVGMAGGVYHNWRLLNFGKENFTATVQLGYEVIGTI